MPLPENAPALPGNSETLALPATSSQSGASLVPSPIPTKRWLKIDFHLHASEDPVDKLDHSSIELLHRAHALGFDALAITLHDHVLTIPEVFDTARELGILLIPAAEMRLEGADVVLVNVTDEETKALHRLDDLAELRRRRGGSVLMFPPHPFYLLGGSIGRRLFKHMDLFDAVEFSHFYTRWLDPNRRALRAAKAHGKTLIAASDTHLLDFFGTHYTLVETPSEPGPVPIFEAIRGGRTQNVSEPLGPGRLMRELWWIFVEHKIKQMRARFAGR